MKTEIRNLMFDLSEKKEIFDVENNRVVSVKEANEVLRKYCYEELGLTKNSTPRQIKRALESAEGKKFFQVIEEILDMQITTGWDDSEWFEEFVDKRVTSDGDRNEFYAEQDIILTVAKVSGDHHDLTIQTLGEGESITIPTSVYAVKVGQDIRLFLLGRKDWSDFVEAVARAFKKAVMDEMYAEFMNAPSKVPASAQFNKTGSLGAATKATFDTLLEDVSAANDSAPVMIMGTKTALKAITALADVNWASHDQKDAVSNMGRLGNYEGTVLVEIPQRFANNDTATKLVAANKLIIMPMVDYKPVKFVDGGETTLEFKEIGHYMDDMQTLEVQRRMGIGTVITRIFGTWTL